MHPLFASTFLFRLHQGPAALVILWHALSMLTALSQQVLQALPDVRLRGPANVAVCLKLQDGTMVLGGTSASVDGVDTPGSLVRLDAQGAVMPGWAPAMKGTVECMGEDGGFLYVAGKGNGITTGSYGAVRRIRIADGLLDPAFSIRTLGTTDQLFFGGGWLFITGNWEDNNIQAWWLGPSPAPENPVFARERTFINSVEWAGAHQGRLLVLSGGTLWSLPLPAVKGDAGYSILKEKYVRTAALDDSGILWILTDRSIRRVRPDQSEPDQVIPLPPDIKDNAKGIAAWKGSLWICNSPASNYGIGPAMIPALHLRGVDGEWRDIGSSVFKGRPGALRAVQVDDQEVRVFGRFSLASGVASFVRLNPNGGLLESRRVLGDGAGIRDVAFLPDGGAVVGGDFEEVDGLPQRGLFRLKPDWTSDREWRADCDGPVATLQVDHDRILAGFHDLIGPGSAFVFGAMRHLEGGHGSPQSAFGAVAGDPFLFHEFPEDLARRVSADFHFGVFGIQNSTPDIYQTSGSPSGGVKFKAKISRGRESPLRKC
ncbi:MAG: hypothetical protein JWM59_2786 [Verrucomicrobiales bacterium]|nr:hypothetical protein [Verrucomicrobiales bacterium]